MGLFDFLKQNIFPTALSEVEKMKNKNEVGFKDYQDNFMITFSKSSSKNMDRALALTKTANEHFETKDESDNVIYQAIFYPSNFKNYLLLYKLIGTWKSTFVFHNGEMLDSKTISQVNRCFGDKVSFNEDKRFCYGASMFTNNPFGCHRLMIHATSRPWYEWIEREDTKYIYFDKEKILHEINSKATVLNHCPAFNIEEVINNLNKLPNRITKKEYQNLLRV